MGDALRLLSGRQCLTEVVTTELYLLQHVDLRTTVDVCVAIFLGRGRLPRGGESIIRQEVLCRVVRSSAMSAAAFGNDYSFS